jgi:hypothetical protein
MSAQANPFKAGVYDGRPIYHTCVEDRVRMVQGMNRAECEAGLKVKGLQKGVVLALERRLRKLAKVAMTIRFEDRGQDFLEWDLDATGKVLESRPMQGWIWCKRTVTNHADLRKGSKAWLDDGSDIRYPLVKVQRFNGATS